MDRKSLATGHRLRKKHESSCGIRCQGGKESLEKSRLERTRFARRCRGRLLPAAPAGSAATWGRSCRPLGPSLRPTPSTRTPSRHSNDGPVWERRRRLRGRPGPGMRDGLGVRARCRRRHLSGARQTLGWPLSSGDRFFVPLLPSDATARLSRSAATAAAAAAAAVSRRRYKAFPFINCLAALFL
jgi:hypothetical protein